MIGLWPIRVLIASLLYYKTECSTSTSHGVKVNFSQQQGLAINNQN